jgi:hypothetical protein
VSERMNEILNVIVQKNERTKTLSHKLKINNNKVVVLHSEMIVRSRE